jgi:hypothetical protein
MHHRAQILTHPGRLAPVGRLCNVVLFPAPIPACALQLPRRACLAAVPRARVPELRVCTMLCRAHVSQLAVGSGWWDPSDARGALPTAPRQSPPRPAKEKRGEGARRERCEPLAFSAPPRLLHRLLRPGAELFLTASSNSFDETSQLSISCTMAIGETQLAAAHDSLIRDICYLTSLLTPLFLCRQEQEARQGRQEGRQEKAFGPHAS